MLPHSVSSLALMMIPGSRFWQLDLLASNHAAANYSQHHFHTHTLDCSLLECSGLVLCAFRTLERGHFGHVSDDVNGNASWEFLWIEKWESVFIVLVISKWCSWAVAKWHEITWQANIIRHPERMDLWFRLMCVCVCVWVCVCVCVCVCLKSISQNISVVWPCHVLIQTVHDLLASSHTCSVTSSSSSSTFKPQGGFKAVPTPK